MWITKGKNPVKKNILIFSLHNPGYLPLMRSLADKGFNLIVNDTPLTWQMDAAGLEYHLWEKFITSEISAHAKSEMTRIGKNLLNNLAANLAMQAFASPLGNFIPITGREFFQQLGPLLGNQIIIMETLEHILNLMDLHLILVDCDNDYTQRILVNSAKRYGIPSLHLAHGIYSQPQVHIAGEADKLNADYIALFGARARDNFVGSGNPPERIFLTGAPLWDPLYKPEARVDARSARRQLGLDLYRPVVLFCTSYAEGSSAYFRFRAQRMQAIHEAVIQALAQIGPQVQLIVRPHPNELQRTTLSPEDRKWIGEAYLHWLGRYGISPVHLSFENKIEAIRAADVVIVADQSSMVPEAMILQKPVIMPTLLHDFKTTYTEADGIIVVEEKARLGEALAGLIRDPSAREAMVQRQNVALPELNFGNDGRSTARVTDLILELTAHQDATRATPPPPRSSLYYPRATESED